MQEGEEEGLSVYRAWKIHRKGAMEAAFSPSLDLCTHLVSHSHIPHIPS